MAASMLRPGEESWQGCLDNLMTRFNQLDAAVVVETLRAQEGHAGRTAQALRKLPASKTAGAAPAVAKENVAPVKVVAPKESSPVKPAAKAGKRRDDSPPASKPLAAKAEPVSKPLAPKASPKREKSPIKAVVPPKEEPAPVVEKPSSPYEAKAAPPAQKASSPYKAKAAPAAAVPAAQPAAAAPPPQPVPGAPDSKLLFVAALQEDIQELNALINAGADLNGRYTGRPNRAHEDKIIDATPLHLVVTMGKTNVAEALLNAGANVDAVMRRALGSGKPPEELYTEMTPLHLAAMEGHANIVDMLIKAGANKSAKMQLKVCSTHRERVFSPLEIAQEMAAKGHSRKAVISLLSN